MNRPIRRLAVAFLVLFILLLGNVTYLQAVHADALDAKPDNRRVLLEQYARDRGPILVADVPIAKSVPSKGEFAFQREYPQATRYAHLTGFYSFIYGRSDLEQSQNSILAGTDDRLFVRRVVDLVTGHPPQGGSVLLTIDPKAQAAADKGLGKMAGAVVALDPRTGRVLALVSHPSYDPSVLAGHDAASVRAAWQQLTSDPLDPLVNRATQERYPPGSTFKLVTAAAALEAGYTPDSKVPAPHVLDLPDTTKKLHNENDMVCSPTGRMTLLDALRISCNTAFAGVGLKLGADALRAQAEKFGFGQQFLPELPGAASAFPAHPNRPETALSAIGQYDVAATPLQMAMVAAAIADGGTVMAPYVVAQTRGPDLTTLSTTKPHAVDRAVSSGVAAELTEMMKAVVASGTGTPAQIPGIAVAGKTGTAQTAPGTPPYAWFVSFAPADNPQVAVAVFIEHADVAPDDIAGGRLGGPIAKAVMEAVIKQ